MQLESHASRMAAVGRKRWQKETIKAGGIYLKHKSNTPQGWLQNNLKCPEMTKPDQILIQLHTSLETNEKNICPHVAWKI